LASEIGKSQTHVSHMAKTWETHGRLPRQSLPSFNEAYHSPEVRGKSQRQLAREVGKSEAHVRYMRKAYELKFAGDLRPFNKASRQSKS